MEDLLSKQTAALSEFSEREKGHLTLGDTTRERLFHLTGEHKVYQDRASDLERRVTDCSEQNRDLIAIAAKKEEVCSIFRLAPSRVGFIGTSLCVYIRFSLIGTPGDPRIIRNSY